MEYLKWTNFIHAKIYLLKVLFKRFSKHGVHLMKTHCLSKGNQFHNQLKFLHALFELVVYSSFSLFDLVKLI